MNNRVMDKRNGILNSGNKCFMNTALQCLANVSDLTNYIYSDNYMADLNRGCKESSVTFEYSKLLTDIMKGEGYVNAGDFIRIFCRVNRDLEIAHKMMMRQQCDTYDFLIKLIDIIHVSLQEEVDIEIKGTPKNDYERLKVKSIKSWIKSIKNEYSEMIDLFFGQYINETHSVGSESKLLARTFDKFNSLSLEIYNSEDGFVASSLYDCLDYHCKVHEMSGDNQYEIGNTKEYVDANRRMCFWKLPKYLIVCLKRFGFSGHGRKINTCIDFPIDDLDLNKYIYHGDMKVKGKESSKYSLIAVANHIGGSLDSGHYYAMNRIVGTDKWVLYNDETVREISYYTPEQLKQRVVSKNAYVLIYARI